MHVISEHHLRALEFWRVHIVISCVPLLLASKMRRISSKHFASTCGCHVSSQKNHDRATDDVSRPARMKLVHASRRNVSENWLLELCSLRIMNLEHRKGRMMEHKTCHRACNIKCTSYGKLTCDTEWNRRTELSGVKWSYTPSQSP